jgi:hypothetical protein
VVYFPLTAKDVNSPEVLCFMLASTQHSSPI